MSSALLESWNREWRAEVERDLENHEDVKVREAIARLKVATCLSEEDQDVIYAARKEYLLNNPLPRGSESDPPDVQGVGSASAEDRHWGSPIPPHRSDLSLAFTSPTHGSRISRATSPVGTLRKKRKHDEIATSTTVLPAASFHKAQRASPDSIKVVIQVEHLLAARLAGLARMFPEVDKEEIRGVLDKGRPNGDRELVDMLFSKLDKAGTCS